MEVHIKKTWPALLLLQIVLPLLAGTVTASPYPAPKPYAESSNPTFPRIEALAESVTAAPPAPARRTPQPQAVETLITDNLTQGAWRYGGGFIYWTNNCGGWIDPVSAYFKRRAETGQIVQVLDQPADCEVLSSNLVADDDGVFYRNFHDQDLEARLTGDPGTIIKLADVSDTYPWSFATDEFFVYYTQPDGIYWAFKLGPIDQQVSDATNVTSLAVDGTYIYWLDDTGLWRSDKTCSTPACWSNKEQLSSNPGENLSWQGFWNEHFVSTIIAAADLAQAGLVTVTVVNPGLEAAPSNPLLFTIQNPTPTISALSPVSATAGGPDLILTVDGADLIDGAVVMWDGQARPTSFVNDTRLTAQIDAADIAVNLPGASAGASKWNRLCFANLYPAVPRGDS